MSGPAARGGRWLGGEGPEPMNPLAVAADPSPGHRL